MWRERSEVCCGQVVFAMLMRHPSRAVGYGGWLLQSETRKKSELETDLGIISTWIAYCLDTIGKGVTEDGEERRSQDLVVGHYPSTKVTKRSDQQ